MEGEPSWPARLSPLSVALRAPLTSLRLQPKVLCRLPCLLLALKAFLLPMPSCSVPPQPPGMRSGGDPASLGGEPVFEF